MSCTTKWSCAINENLLDAANNAEKKQTRARQAHRLASGPTLALGHLRRLMRGSQDRDLAGQLDAETAAFKACAATDDFRVGVDAFLNRKMPSFSGL